jgi:tyrosinase
MSPRVTDTFQGNFLSWHRYFTWTWERALREECGYEGYQPYVNWGKYAHDIVGSPLFDGSETSISGDGDYAPHNGTGIPSNENPVIYLPPGNGSGCVTTGPFKNMTVRLGPVAPSLTGLPPNPQPDGLGLNERCLRRDLSNVSAGKGTTEAISCKLMPLSSIQLEFS